eukprot:m.214854 g.214854  ORF g.214854 m.214854 type:complete len:309 (+) comp16969_c0_seq1:210-1136(+)
MDSASAHPVFAQRSASALPSPHALHPSGALHSLSSTEKPILSSPWLVIPGSAVTSASQPTAGRLIQINSKKTGSNYHVDTNLGIDHGSENDASEEGNENDEVRAAKALFSMVTNPPPLVIKRNSSSKAKTAFQSLQRSHSAEAAIGTHHTTDDSHAAKRSRTMSSVGSFGDMKLINTVSDPSDGSDAGDCRAGSAHRAARSSVSAGLRNVEQDAQACNMDVSDFDAVLDLDRAQFKTFIAKMSPEQQKLFKRARRKKQNARSQQRKRREEQGRVDKLKAEVMTLELELELLTSLLPDSGSGWYAQAFS